MRERRALGSLDSIALQLGEHLDEFNVIFIIFLRVSCLQVNDIELTALESSLYRLRNTHFISIQESKVNFSSSQTAGGYASELRTSKYILI